MLTNQPSTHVAVFHLARFGSRFSEASRGFRKHQAVMLTRILHLFAALVCVCNGGESFAPKSKQTSSTFPVTNRPRPEMQLQRLSRTSNQNEAEDDNEVNESLTLEAFHEARKRRQSSESSEIGPAVETYDHDDGFDGYALRNILQNKWGKCYDLEFQRAFVVRGLYLNVLPFYLGKMPFRHPTEYDYLCHLQAVVEILKKYNQLDYVLYQIQETKKKPLAQRSPIVAVPLRLDLTKEQVDQILG